MKILRVAQYEQALQHSALLQARSLEAAARSPAYLQRRPGQDGFEQVAAEKSGCHRQYGGSCTDVDLRHASTSSGVHQKIQGFPDFFLEVFQLFFLFCDGSVALLDLDQFLLMRSPVPVASSWHEIAATS